MCSIRSWESLTFVLSPYAFDHFFMFEEDYNATVLVIVLLISLFSHGIRASDVGGDCSEEQSWTCK